VSWPDPPTDINAGLDDYLTAYTAAWEEDQSRTRTAEALTTVIGACERAMQPAIGDPDRLLQSLADDLDELMDHLKTTVTQLNGASTPTEAINNDTVTVWRELPELRRTYDSIRHAQELVMLDTLGMNHRSDYVNDPLADDTHIRNLDAVLPGWREPDTRFSMQGVPPDRRPWPTDAIEQLVWFINGPAEIWLPTTVQLAALHIQRNTRLNPMPV
jgi:hypothetical protein